MEAEKKKSAWEIIEEKAREIEGVDEAYSLRWAKIDFEEGSPEYAEYRLRKMKGEHEGTEIKGKIVDYAAIRP